MTTVSKGAQRAMIVAAMLAGATVATYRQKAASDPEKPYQYSFTQGLGLAKAYYTLGPMIQKVLDPERGHRLAVETLAKGPTMRTVLGLVDHAADPESIKQNVFGMEFASPVGIAAGFDKNAECVDGLNDCGFAFVEIGSVTPLPQPGNDRPRVFRLAEDRAVINRYGFNSDGADKVAERLNVHATHKQSVKTTPIILGVNLGKNKTTVDAASDFVIGVEKLGKFADYLVVNVSSPNTPGLRDLQGKEQMRSLLVAVKKARDALPITDNKNQRIPPLLVKIAPDLTEDDKIDIADVVLSTGVDGLIVSNTTVARPETLKSAHAKEVGGLSGRPLKEVSTKVIGDMYSLTQGRVPIIGVGGVETGRDVYDKMKAGASLVQLYSAFSFDGPVLVSNIKQELMDQMKADGVKSVKELVGADHRN